ncbi:MAG: 3-oxoacyl-(acyl-carrier-protein) reductase FabG [Syntrophorhabdaceae bacterium PtaU1.Bin034]|nr:MAG: 3-oxoacyl-(acyl-carrier-protein) reductase FabG [Syntrophorhabdaceae bacterium PtaU1.Bin034]
MDLKGKVAIVTGAVGVIGRGISGTLAGEGMHVAVADLSQEQCNDFAEEIKASGGSALGVGVDVSSRESTRHMAQKVLQAFGRIDALVNNAGVIAVAPLAVYREEDFDRIIAVNLKGSFLCAQAVVGHMIERKSGRIINISSVAAKRPGPLQTAYAASKHGQLGLTQVWCQELGQFNITVNAVCPGFIDSPMWKDHLSPAYAPAFGVEPSELIGTVAKTNSPLGKPQTPAEIGEAVAFFCRADNVSGQALVIDGGHAMW